jgi:hypothetical protein
MDKSKLENGLKFVLNQLNANWEQILSNSLNQGEFISRLNFQKIKGKIKSNLGDGYKIEFSFNENGATFFLYQNAKNRLNDENISSNVLIIVNALDEKELFKEMYSIKEESLNEEKTILPEVGQLSFEF